MKSRGVTFLNNLDGFLGKRTRTMIPNVRLMIKPFILLNNNDCGKLQHNAVIKSGRVSKNDTLPPLDHKLYILIYPTGFQELYMPNKQPAYRGRK